MKRTFCPNKKHGKARMRESKQVRYVDNPIKRLSKIESYRRSDQEIKGFKNVFESSNIIELFDDMIA